NSCPNPIHPDSWSPTISRFANVELTLEGDHNTNIVCTSVECSRTLNPQFTSPSTSNRSIRTNSR
ncbi:hypothetical protein KSS87_000791, partial [Heliosperma pusillum]